MFGKRRTIKGQCSGCGITLDSRLIFRLDRASQTLCCSCYLVRDYRGRCRGHAPASEDIYHVVTIPPLSLSWRGVGGTGS